MIQKSLKYFVPMLFSQSLLLLSSLTIYLQLYCLGFQIIDNLPQNLLQLGFAFDLLDIETLKLFDPFLLFGQGMF